MDSISIIGIGRLGLCFALTLEESGFNVLGLDINSDYVDSINQKTLTSSEPEVETKLKASQNLRATLSIDEIVAHSDLIFCLVPTNTLPGGHYDHSIVDGVVDKLSRLDTHGKHFILCSTVIPGYCEKIQKRLEGKYSVTYNPEFIAQGSILKDQRFPDMILIGGTDNSPWDELDEIYYKICIGQPPICRMKLTEAEITKLGINSFLVMKITYANMIGDLVKESGGTPSIVLNAIGSDSRIGHKFLGYGFGPGGPCLPRDTRALSTYSNLFRSYFSGESLLEVIDKENRGHLQHQIQDAFKTYPRGATIVLDQVTYKPGVEILEDSQQLLYALALAGAGYNVVIRESKNVINEVRNRYGSLFQYEEKE